MSKEDSTAYGRQLQRMIDGDRPAKFASPADAARMAGLTPKKAKK